MARRSVDLALCKVNPKRRGTVRTRGEETITQRKKDQGNVMNIRLCFSALLMSTVICWSGRADAPGAHPAFLHALTDLRDARWNLEHRPGDNRVRAHEENATVSIDRAIGEITKAAIEDRKNTYIHPKEDARLDHPGRLHHALDLLRKARADASGEEDNPEVRGLRHRAIEHIDVAIRETERAIYDVEHNL